jgi:hypothetical protein
MIVYENDCVGCPTEMGCLGESCPKMNVPYYYCDKCNGDAEYEYVDKHYCLECLLDEIGAYSII